jgi:hypothetical protein
MSTTFHTQVGSVTASANIVGHCDDYDETEGNKYLLFIKMGNNLNLISLCSYECRLTSI